MDAFKQFEKKIVPYIDGSLAPDEVSEFEAFVSTNTDFQNLVQKKMEEVQILKDLIPKVNPDPQTIESLRTEVKASVFNLLKEEPTDFWDSLRLKFEELLTR